MITPLPTGGPKEMEVVTAIEAHTSGLIWVSIGLEIQISVFVPATNGS